MMMDAIFGLACFAIGVIVGVALMATIDLPEHWINADYDKD